MQKWRISLKSKLLFLKKFLVFLKKKQEIWFLKKVEEEMSREVAVYLKDREDEAKLEADRKAKELLVSEYAKIF